MTKPVFLGLIKVGEKYARILRLLRKLSSNSFHIVFILQNVDEPILLKNPWI